MQFCVAVRKCWFVRVVDWAGRVYLFGYRVNESEIKKEETAR